MKKRNIKITVITALSLTVIIAVSTLINNVIIPNSKYKKAIALLDKGNVVEAYEVLIALNGYKDSNDKATAVFDKYFAEKTMNAKVGDCVTFGTYEQDNDISNGMEEIEWIVLEKQDDKLLVISKHGLDAKPYNTAYGHITWENCTLRSWLNNEFIHTAFSEEKRALIPMVSMENRQNIDNHTNYGNQIMDQVFLLSRTEANRYLNSKSTKECKPTAYARTKIEYVHDDGTCDWWVRIPGHYRFGDFYTYHSGTGSDYSFVGPLNSMVIRPALWIDLNS